MNRVRISTTVQGDTLTHARKLLPGPDSRLLDKALKALIEQIEEERELAALEAYPYEDDPDLTWVASTGPDLPYDSAIPEEVLQGFRRRMS